MPTIRVNPDELEQVASRMQEAAGLLEQLGPQIRERSAALAWEAAPKGYIDDLVTEATGHAGTLAERAADLQRFLLERAQAYRTADEQERLRDLLTRFVGLGSSMAAAAWSLAPAGPSALQPPSPEQLRYMHKVLGVQEEGFGAQTQAALQRLQAAYGLPASPAGQVDPQTWALIKDHAYRATNGRPPAEPAIPMQPLVPYHRQGDPAFASVKVGDSTYGEVGCTLTSLSMLVDYHRDGFEATKETMAELAQSSVNENGDVVWTKAEGYVRDKWGLILDHERLQEQDKLAEAMSRAYDSLKQGEPMVVGIANGPNMHWVVIRGYTGTGAPTDPSQFLLNDPGAGRKTLADLLNDPKYRGGTLEATVTIREGS